MRVLIVNDDGIYAPGLRALAEMMRGEGHEVNIVAPQTERSGAGHSMTMFGPVEIFDVVLQGLEDVPSYAISGTPVDCVKIGAGSLFPVPDLVLSGINMGTNLGVDIFGSGTVNAAAAAIEKGIPAMAFSIGSHYPKNLSLAVEIARNAIHKLLPKVNAKTTLLNINVPDLPKEQIKGVKWAPIARPNPDYPFNEFISPRGLRWYWDSAAKLNTFTEDEDVDNRWYKEGFITISPLRFDIVDRQALMELKQFDAELL